MPNYNESFDIGNLSEWVIISDVHGEPISVQNTVDHAYKDILPLLDEAGEIRMRRPIDKNELELIMGYIS